MENEIQTPAEPTAGDETALPIEQAEDQVEATAEGEEAEPVDDTEGEKSRSQKRREQRKAAEQRARQTAAELAARLAEVERRLDRAKAPDMPAPPQENEFTDYADYVAAKAVYAAEQAAARRFESAIKAEADDYRKQVGDIERRTAAERRAAYDEAAAEAKAVYPDYIEVAHTAPISDAVGQAIMALDSPTHVAYYFGQNHAEARRISQLMEYSPLEAAIQIGRLEARLTAPRAKTITAAPEPISPVRPAGKAARSPEKMSFAEYEKARRAGQF